MEAGKQFDEMFTENTLDELVTFRQKEDRACEVVDKLWEWLMEKHIKLDEDKSGSESDICPECLEAAKRRGLEGEKEKREVVGQRGAVGFERGGCECRKCRKVFFPSGPKDENRDRRIQSKRA